MANAHAYRHRRLKRPCKLTSCPYCAMNNTQRKKDGKPRVKNSNGHRRNPAK